MKYTNEDNDERVYPTLGIILEAGKSFDDATAKIIEVKEITPSVATDIIIEEVK